MPQRVAAGKPLPQKNFAAVVCPLYSAFYLLLFSLFSVSPYLLVSASSCRA